MTVIIQPPKSVRPQAGTLVLGFGNSNSLYKMGTGGAQIFDVRARADTASGSDARVFYARLHQYGAGGGEAIRAYAHANTTLVATGGTLNGLHASMNIAASCSISGQGFGARVSLEAAADTRTINGNLGALCVESNIATGNTIPAGVALIHLKELGAATCKKAFRFPDVASAGMLAAHVTDAMSHSVRCVTDSGTVVYLMATTTATNRTGGA